MQKRGRKALAAVLIAVAAAAVIWFVYYLVHYLCYDSYKDCLSSGTYEEGTQYSPIRRNADGTGMDLVAESEFLRLYTDTATGYIAVEDKRDGSVTYSNPPGAEDDTVANTSNKNYLRSQFMLYYYTSDVKSGMYDSYSECVKRKQLSCESIANGIRYRYTVGNTVSRSAADPIYFEVPLEYRLEADRLEVSVPASAIAEHGGGAVYRIQLLRYMGAGGRGEDGYLVVPDGSGAIIYFNNGKTKEAQYSQYIYDIDPMASGFVSTENTYAARLNLFGICRDDRSILATIEDGASTCVLTAGVSGQFNDYNYCYPTFVLRNIDNLKSFGNSSVDVYVMEEDIYDTDCRVRYTFINEGSGYSGLAAYYRDRLVTEGVLAEKKSAGDIPLYCDVLSAVGETSHILGLRYSHELAMTTFEEAGIMSDELCRAGITNQVINLQGWFNGGYYQETPGTVSVVSSLGNRKDLERLDEKVARNGGRLFAEVAFQKITAADKWFNSRAESSRYYGAGYTASFGVTDPATYRNTSGLMFKELRYYLLSPRFLPRYVSGFASCMEKYDIAGISLRDLGDVLVSDKRRTRLINREEALDVVLAQAQVLRETGKQLMTQNANAYAFSFGTDILSVPTYSNAFPITDAEIPLYEMLIHGYIDYSCEVLNSQDSLRMDERILNLIETGASPHYVFTMKESSLMKDTAASSFYATTFARHAEDAVTTYNKVNGVLSRVQGAVMTEHEILPDGLRKCTYDNGVTIYVNYSDEPCTADGITVAPRSYETEETAG